jgi:DNA invertase Pin-like site-specific DNA recombinase/predicted HTH domain antitoxin
MKCIIIARVSTFDQNVDPQIEILKSYAKSLGYKHFKLIYAKESGFLGVNYRKSVNELFSFYEENKDYRTVFCFEISRLSRKESALHYIKDWLISNKIQLYIYDKKYKLFEDDFQINRDTSILFTLFGYFAESEMITKKIRFKNARLYWNELGYSIAGKLLFGYQRQKQENKRNLLVIDDKESNEIIQVFSWYAYGINDINKNPSIKDIAIHCIKNGLSKYLHIKRNVNKLLKEEAYLGFKTTNNKRKKYSEETGDFEGEYITTNTKIKYPQIISEELFQEVQKKLKLNNLNAIKSSKHITILSKLIKCPECNRFLGGDYRVTKDNQSKNSYRCLASRNIINCSNKGSYSMQMLDSVVWSLVKKDRALLSKLITSINPEKYKNNILNDLNYYKNKETEINESIEFEIKKISLLQKGHKNVNEAIAVIETKLNSFNKELKKNNIKVKELTQNLDSLNENQKKAHDKLLSLDIEHIENNKSILKDYINLYVDHIKIHKHSSRFSLIEIIFKFESDKEVKHKIQDKIIRLDGLINRNTFILIDKTITRSLKIFKINKELEIKNNEIFLASKTITIENLHEIIMKFFKNGDNVFLDHFIDVEYIKLNLYEKKEIE